MCREVQLILNLVNLFERVLPWGPVVLNPCFVESSSFRSEFNPILLIKFYFASLIRLFI